MREPRWETRTGLLRAAMLGAAAVGGWITVGCGARPEVGGPEKAAAPAATTAAGEPVTVFVAASAERVLEAVGEAFTRQTGVEVRLNAASSSALALQIEQGAPADLLISASPEWIDRLAAAGKIERQAPLVENSLVLIVPAGESVGVTGVEDLADPRVRRLALADPESVPAGRYAREALEAARVWGAVAAKVVPADDVSQALLYVSRGEADAGIVYRTEARQSKTVRVVQSLDGLLSAPVRYPVGLIRREGRSTAAPALYEFLLGAEGVTILESHGFRRPVAAGG